MSMEIPWYRKGKSTPEKALVLKEDQTPFVELANKFAPQAERALKDNGEDTKRLVAVVEARLQEIRSSREGKQEIICRQIAKENEEFFPDSIQGEKLESAAFALALAYKIIENRSKAN